MLLLLFRYRKGTHRAYGFDGIVLLHAKQEGRSNPSFNLFDAEFYFSLS